MLKATAEIKNSTYDNFGTTVDGINVTVHWTGAQLDRPTSGGFGLKGTDRKLAERLRRAIDAGVVYVNPVVATDIYGKTYVASNCVVSGKHLNADLRRLGY
jgi:hypothetical protein